MLHDFQKFTRTSPALAGLVLFLSLAAPRALAAATTGAAVPAGETSEPYIELFPNGKQKVVGLLAGGRKSGKWTTFDETGRVLETAIYKDGERHGAWILNHPTGRPRVRGSFQNGRATGTIAMLDERGQLARQLSYPRTYDAIAKVFAELYPKNWETPRFTTEPVTSAPYIAGALDPACFDEPLKLTQLYRFLAGLSWQDIRIDPAFTNLAQHGAVILAKIGSLTHEPAKPPDMDDAFFKLAFDGCYASNLHTGQESLAEAVRGFMDDSDSRNIARVGHRQWILNPSMQRVGFGYAQRFTTMCLVDRRPGNRVMRTELPVVAFPGIGYYPFELVKSHYAWSAHLNPRRFVVAGAKVMVEQLDDNYLPVRQIPVQTVTAAPDPNGAWSTVIFKPEWERYGPGRYWVSFEGLKNPRGDAVPLGYLVDLVRFTSAETTEGDAGSEGLDHERDRRRPARMPQWSELEQ